MSKCCNKHDPVPNTPAASIKEAPLVDDILASMAFPDEIITSVTVSSKFLSVGTTQSMGLAATLGNHPTMDEKTRLDKIPGSSLAEAAQLLKDDSLFLRAIGLAATNAGMDRPTTHGNAGAVEILRKQGQGKRVGIVGHFPFTEEVREFASETMLFELTDAPGALHRNQWEDALGRCEIMALTGTALLTRYMAYYLEHTRHALTIIVGPSTPLSPVLFDNGADVLCTSKVVDPVRVAEGVGQGLPFRQLKKLGIEYVTWAATEI